MNMNPTLFLSSNYVKRRSKVFFVQGFFIFMKLTMYLHMQLMLQVGVIWGESTL
jgi:hypothetical protein